MAQTSISTTTPYCTTEEALNHCDWRALADLCSDTDDRLTRAALIASTVWLAQINAACGMVESAAMLGGRYLPVDLAALGGASEETLKRIVAKIAEGLAFSRRPEKGLAVSDEFQSITGPGGWLDRLASGERIFAFQEATEAGRLESTEQTQADIDNRNGMRTQARRYFGRRAADFAAE